MADLEAFISDVLMEKIAIEKSREKENASCNSKDDVDLDFGDRLFAYFMESYGRVNKIEKEYQKVQMADGYQSFD
jgi:hypothetical protein